MLYLNMCAQVQLGAVLLKNINSVEINENILEMSNTAKLVTPRYFGKLNSAENILDLITVGDKATIKLGYDDKLDVEFVGYISEIESEMPLVVHLDDEMYPLKRTNYIKSYGASTTLKQVLKDIIPAKIMSFDCPDVRIGKYAIDNASAFVVLQDLMQNFGLYSRLQNGVLKVGLAYDFGSKAQNHTYVVGRNTKKSDLKYKRKDDVKIRFKAVSTNPNGKKTTVVVGSKDTNASERTLNFAGPMTEAELKQKALAVMAKYVYDGYTGSITGFGLPRTHAGDALTVKDNLNPERNGKYMIEQVVITYDDSSGYSRKNSLSFKLA